MELVNATEMPAAWTMGLDPDGREHVVVVVKGTFGIPREGEDARLAAQPAPLVMADEFTGEPGLSATLYESDFALVKQFCDVVLHGAAYAPEGRPAPHVPVSLRIGRVQKQFRVVGNRTWQHRLLTVKPTAPEPFTRMPISYDVAYGGTDVSEKDPEKKDAYAKNPAGVGHYPVTKIADLPGRALPNTEELRNPVKSWKGSYEPMSFGPIGRNFPARLANAGTYDQGWLDDVAPFLPADFDPRYHQCAPPDQQIEHPKGGELVELIHLTPAGRLRFALPRVDMPVEFTKRNGDRIEKGAVVDTIVIEPDLDRFQLVWRASLPLRDDVFEIPKALIGRMPPGPHRGRGPGADRSSPLPDRAGTGVD